VNDKTKCALLVIDGLGIGAMADAPPEDEGSNTLLHVWDHAGPLKIPNLASLGLGNVSSVAELEPVDDPGGAYGTNKLAHPGADTYMGHQELMGARLDKIRLSLLAAIRTDVVEALEAAGYSTSSPIADGSPIVVNDIVLVADNIEARPGLNINVTGSLDDISFEELTHIGEVVREPVFVPRVIVVAGRGFGMSEIRDHIKERAPGQIGVDSPELGVYDEHYRVRHLGIELDASAYLPTLATAAGYKVALVGKAADVIQDESAEHHNMVPTGEVLDCTLSYVQDMTSGLIVANVQETDLAGHEQDAERYARVVEEVDAFLPRLLEQLGAGDFLFITGDHGNDPTIGHSQHTRETTPLLVTGDVRRVDLGTRDTLADMAATMADLLGLPNVASGSSFAADLRTPA
jgi:phosphopentomutase